MRDQKILTGRIDNIVLFEVGHKYTITSIKRFNIIIISIISDIFTEYFLPIVTKTLILQPCWKVAAYQNHLHDENKQKDFQKKKYI